MWSTKISVRWSFEAADAGRAYGVRRNLLAYLRSRSAQGSDLDAAALIFGELVGNVVRHAPGPISIDIFWESDIAVLRVVDRGPGFDWDGHARLPDRFAESGRGLFIAFSVAHNLKVRRIPGNGTEATAWLPVLLSEAFKAKI
ncbi:MAG TPA: ATP-binding protein [Candidatus Baltobacteraceae bacterium]|nr:ATP-binding protein [Candidatus Baltobacteraceae bacterium]